MLGRASTRLSVHLTSRLQERARTYLAHSQVGSGTRCRHQSRTAQASPTCDRGADDDGMRGLIGWILVSFATGAVGALATRHAREFYAGLVKPTWAPPGWLFGPV